MEDSPLLYQAKIIKKQFLLIRGTVLNRATAVLILCEIEIIIITDGKLIKFVIKQDHFVFKFIRSFRQFQFFIRDLNYKTGFIIIVERHIICRRKVLRTGYINIYRVI